MVLSLAYDKKEWIVDSNVVRIYRRYFGIKTSKEGRRDKHVVEISKIYAFGKANLALLDFGALVCVPRKPKCATCSLSKSCCY